MKRVVVTGIGAITPIGVGIPAYLQGLKNGVSGANLITRFDASKFKTLFACEVKNFVPEEHIDRKEARRMDPFTQFAMYSADEALRSAGLAGPEGPTGQVNPDRAGIVWASGIGGLSSLENEIMDFTRGGGVPRYNPFMIPKMIPDIAAGLISIKYGFRGLNYCTVSACASSSHAMVVALDHIRAGRADVILAGGSEAAITPAGIGGFNAMKALSERNDDYPTASRPFDKDRDGFVLGEGGGGLVLESLDHALARGAHIFAELAGGGMTADAYHMTAPHPEGLGAANVMHEALRDGNLTIADIQYVNVHGTSTPLGDGAELKAIEKVFGDRAFQINVSSTKSMTGHLLGAAGAIEAIACILAINHNFIPPTINHFTDDPEIDPRFHLTFNRAKETTVHAAISNTFGFGGHNSSVLFKRYVS